MTPDQINEQHGKPSWTCNTCKATRNLMWWRGFSVAICQDSSICAKAQTDKFNYEMEREAEFEKFEREWRGEP